MRTLATNEFEKNFFKLMANAIYGKTMENVRKRVDIRLRGEWDGQWGVRRLVSQPNFKRTVIFDNDFVAVEMKRTNILLNKPIAIGMAVLDLSKTVMYNYYYNHLKEKYCDNVQLMYTDTDSFIVEVKTDCFYTDMIDDLHLYDTSDYPLDNAYGIPLVNKKVPGLFKDELNSKILTDFVGLRSKMYSIRSENRDLIKKAKGVKANVLKKQIDFNDYLECLVFNDIKMRHQYMFRNKLHRMYTICQNRIALSPYDDKRVILKNKVDTLPYGHFMLQKKNLALRL